MQLFNRSNMTNGLYSDVVTEPLKMRLPDVDLDLIFDRFEDDIEKICKFYWERRGLRPNAKVRGWTARKPAVGATNKRG